MQLADCVAWSVCGGTAHVDMYTTSCGVAKRAILAQGAFCFPDQKTTQRWTKKVSGDALTYSPLLGRCPSILVGLAASPEASN